MPRSSKKKKTCFSRKELRNKVRKGVRNTLRKAIRKAIQTRRKKHALRKQRGGNYTSDKTVVKVDGVDMKSPNQVVVATAGGKVQSVSSYITNLNPLSPEAY